RRVDAGDVPVRVVREVRREARRRLPVAGRGRDDVAVVGKGDLERRREAPHRERAAGTRADVELVRLRRVAAGDDQLPGHVDVIADEGRLPVREHRQVGRIDLLLDDLVEAGRGFELYLSVLVRGLELPLHRVAERVL